MKSVLLNFMLFYYAYNIKKTVLCNPIWAIKGNIIKRKMFKIAVEFLMIKQI